MYRALIRLLAFQFAIIQILFKSKNNLVLETIELRQQLMIYQTKKEDSKNITDLTRSLLVALKKTWPKWMDALIIVKPETVIDWQKRRFKKYWTKKSAKRKKLGTPPIKLEIHQLLKKMATENFIWGTPRIYFELLKLGYTKNQISQITISRYLKGWWNYYGLTEGRTIFRSLNGWILRRLRCLVWTQWKNPRTRVRNLLKLGIFRRDAFLCGNARKKMWRMSRIKWVIIAMPNKYFLDRGLLLPGN